MPRNFNFEKFSDPESPYEAKISIRRTGQFGFNAGAVNKYKLSECPFVVLYYDVQQRVIGIELKHEKCESALELNMAPSNVFISAKNFCDRFGLNYSGASRFPLKKDSESGFLFFEIGEREDDGDENASDE